MLFSYSLLFPIEQSAEYSHKNKKMAMLEYQITIMLFRTLKYIGKCYNWLHIGCLAVILCRPPRALVRFTITTTAFGNTGNIPLAVVASVCHSSDAPLGPDCYGNGIAYVYFSQWVYVILVCTLVYRMMEPPLEQYEIVDEEVEI
ncbi:hypothetical protein POTOM_020803 [Populus tomentosa]|uniref:Auxin efflux carrier family protein n=1 Tax=Populus tomentosa TaxID=118781 RepID=A0A8X7ZQ14_POPTO|nr:hypothetical protein POTOM_020803 [Populus tomentosa]